MSVSKKFYYPYKKKAIIGDKEKPISMAMVKKEIKKELKEEIELKFFQNTIGPLIGIDYKGNAPATFSITQIPQGVTDAERVGDTITFESIRIRGAIYYLGTAPAFPVGGIMRILVWRWVPSTSVPLTSSLLPYAANTTAAPFSEVSHDYQQMFQILADNTYQMNEGAFNPVKFDIKCKYIKGKKQQFILGSGTIATNQVYIGFMSDNSGLVTWGVTANYSVKYYDT